MAAGGNGKGNGKGKPPVPPGQNDAPTAIGDVATTQEDAPVAISGNVLSNDTDPNAGDTKAVTTAGTISGAYGTLLLNSDGSYTYTVNNGDSAVQSLGQGQSVSDAFFYTMRDAAGATSSATLTVTIQGSNDAASISGTATGIVAEDGTGATSGVLAVSDFDNGENVFQTPTSLLGTYGSFSFDASTGAWSYALDNDAVQSLASTDIVHDTLTIVSFDGTASQTIDVTVSGENDAATISGTAAGAVAEDGTQAASGVLVVTDPDSSENRFQASALLAGTYGSFSFDATTGAWSYTLDNDAAQSLTATDIAYDTLTVTSFDSTESETIEVTIHGANDAASIFGTTAGSVTEDGTQVASGTISVLDVDTGEDRFLAPASLAGTYGNFSFEALTGVWSYTLNSSAPNVQVLNSTDTVHDTLIVTSLDGTAAQTIDVTTHGADEIALPTVPIQRVSLGFGGVQGNGQSGALGSGIPIIYGDNRYVAYYSQASNLVANDTNGKGDFFVYDRLLDTTERIPAGINGPSDGALISVSSDGRYFCFNSLSSTLVAGDTNGTSDIFVYDRLTQTYERIGGNGYSTSPHMSANGQVVTFHSSANDLVAGDTNGAPDCFIYDLSTNTIERIMGLGGVEDNSGANPTSISADGRYVVFYSAFGGFVPADTNGVSDTFVYDRVTQAVERVSVSSTGAQGNGHSDFASITSDGRYVVFSSEASTLVAGDTNGVRDIFVHDRLTDTTERVSVTTSGGQLNGHSHIPTISDDGRFVAFHSTASNGGIDTNGTEDVFVFDRTTDTLMKMSVSNGVAGNGQSAMATISADGQYVVFDSYASNLVAGDTNGLQDVFLVHLSSFDYLVV